MISLSDFRKVNPGVRVVDYGGPWLVVYCRGVGVRYDSREEAKKEAREECCYCFRGRVNDHPIYELETAGSESDRRMSRPWVGMICDREKPCPTRADLALDRDACRL